MPSVQRRHGGAALRPGVRPARRGASASPGAPRAVRCRGVTLRPMLGVRLSPRSKQPTIETQSRDASARRTAHTKRPLTLQRHTRARTRPGPARAAVHRVLLPPAAAQNLRPTTVSAASHALPVFSADARTPAPAPTHARPTTAATSAAVHGRSRRRPVGRAPRPTRRQPSQREPHASQATVTPGCSDPQSPESATVHTGGSFPSTCRPRDPDGSPQSAPAPVADHLPAPAGPAAPWIQQSLARQRPHELRGITRRPGRRRQTVRRRLRESRRRTGPRLAHFRPPRALAPRPAAAGQRPAQCRPYRRLRGRATHPTTRPLAQAGPSRSGPPPGRAPGRPSLSHRPAAPGPSSRCSALRTAVKPDRRPRTGSPACRLQPASEPGAPAAEPPATSFSAAPATAASGAPPAAAEPGGTDLDELARRLYEPLVRPAAGRAVAGP